MNMTDFKTEKLKTQFCVVGGGMAGICAAVAAAREGVKTVLVQDRPVLGGNASSEIRMWICGAGSHNPQYRESGLLAELELENLRWNPAFQYNVWDHVMQNFVQKEPNLKLLLNCSCNGVKTDASKIVSVSAWQLTTQKKFEIEADYFADCSGDSVLRVSGAEFRCGREARSEFNESHAPEVADSKTMGNSILFQTKYTGKHKAFTTPPWAHVFEEKGFHRYLNPVDNFWWMETGGEQNTISDAEEIRDELLRIAYGVWDLVKNSHKGLGRDYELEWIGALPGKRENIRYVGDHILTQNDVERQGRFEDIVAYGGWSMDDHHPAAFYHKGEPTIFHPAPCPYGIPYRSLYSKNIDNLYFAGRNISATHMAMSSTRVMATCAMEGQAVGTAVSLCVKNRLTPRGVYQERMTELQNLLMDNDSFLPWHVREVPSLTREAKLSADSESDVELLRNGVDRAIGENTNCFEIEFGTPIIYSFDEPKSVKRVRIVFDSELTQKKSMPCYYPENGYEMELPETLVKEFSVEVLPAGSNKWQEVEYCEDNFKRLIWVDINQKVSAVRLVPEASWGASRARIFAFDVR